ncbi:hypothetical protein ZWY2020_058349 [Hordeum vulgare]|nr:hypothetical protein ZWY2020_058349 [Hordeum vulgare]
MWQRRCRRLAATVLLGPDLPAQPRRHIWSLDQWRRAATVASQLGLAGALVDADLGGGGQEYTALQALKAAIFEDPAAPLSSWQGPNVCVYKGVYCSSPPTGAGAAAGAVVAGIDLNHASLKGTLPAALSSSPTSRSSTLTATASPAPFQTRSGTCSTSPNST